MNALPTEQNPAIPQTPNPTLSNEETNPNATEDLKSLSVKSYLDKTVTPVLLLGLAETAKERPSNPVEFLANFLLQNNPQIKKE